MRAALVMALALALSACSGVRPGTPPMAGPAEMQPRPGLLSGPTGDFLIVGDEPAAPPRP